MQRSAAPAPSRHPPGCDRERAQLGGVRADGHGGLAKAALCSSPARRV